MKWIFAIATFICLGMTTVIFADATCPAPNAKEITAQKSAQYGVTYVGHLQGKPNVLLRTDFEHEGPPQKFYAMMVTPISPYFISCSYDTGNVVLKTQKENFYDTAKTCQLVGAHSDAVQFSRVANVCHASHVSDCKLVCQ